MKKKSSDATTPADKSVTLCIGSNLFILNGVWDWEMAAAAVYCSDVMHFPTDFEGTKGIVHPDDLQNLTSAVALLSDGELSKLDFRLITTWGEVKAVSGLRVRLRKPLLFEAPAQEPWEETLQQLASRKEADWLSQRAALADITEKLHNIGSWAVNKSTGEAWYSDGVYHIHNLPPQSLNTHANTFHVFLHPEDRVAVMDAFEAAYAQEVPVHLNYRILLPGGTVRPVRLVTYWTHNRKGQPLFCGVLHNQTEEQKRADHLEDVDQTVRLLQQVFRFSEQNWHTGYWLVNLVTRKATFSENYYRIYGLKQQQLPGYNAFLNLVHPDDRIRVHELISRMYTEHQLPEAEFRIIRPDGKQRQLKQSGRVFIRGSELMMMGAVQDISVQRGLEKKIAELNEKAGLQDLVQAVTETLTETSFITWHPEGQVRWSEGFYRLLGYKPDSVEALPRLLHRQIHPDDLKAFKDSEALVTNGQPHDGLRFRLVSRSGTRQLSISFHRLPSASHELVVGVVQDFSRETALHRKLADTNGFAETLNAATSDMVVLTDRENTVLSWNRAAAEKTGIKAEDALYSNLFDLFPALNEESYLKNLQTAVWGTEVRELKSRNLYLKRPHHYYLVPLLNEGSKASRILHVVQDVSREWELQQQLSERLNFIESLVEASVDRIVVLDRHMNYLYWNKRAEEHYAISKARVIGRNILEVFPGLRADPSYAEFRKVLKGETVYIPAAVQDDNKEYFETYLIPVKDERTEVTAILWIVHDLSKEFLLQEEQRKAQQLLEEEHRRLRDAQAVGCVGSFEWNVDTNVSHWSDELYRINGLEPQSEEISLQNVDQFIHPDDMPELTALREKSLQVPGKYSLVHRIFRRDGDLRWIKHQWESTTGDGNRVIRVTGVVQDITAQKRAEERIGQQAHFIRRIADTVPDMVSVMELETRKVDYLNRDAFLAHGFDPDLMAVRSKEELGALIHPDDRLKLAEYFARFTNASDDETVTVEYRSMDDAGNRKWFMARGKAFQRNAEGKVTHVLNVIQNITDRKQSQEALQENETRFRSLVEAYAQAVWEADAGGAVVADSPSWRASTGQTVEEWLGDGWANAFHPDDRERVVSLWQKAVASRQNMEAVFRLEQAGGGWRWTQVRATPILDAGGTVLKWSGMNTDVHDEMLAKERLQEALAGLEAQSLALQNSKDLLQTVFNTLFSGVAVFDAVRDGQGKIVDLTYRLANSVVERYAGRPVVGERYFALFPDLKTSGLAEKLVRVIETGETTDFETFYQGDGFKSWFRITAAKFGDGLISSVEDITERKKAEEEVKNNMAILQQAEELAEMGSWEYDIETEEFNWSDGMYRLFGLPKRMQVRPETYLDFVVAEDLPVAKRIVKKFRKKPQPFEETIQIKRNGEQRLLRVKGSVVCNRAGVPQTIVGVDVDITDAKAAEQKIAKSQHWLEQTAKASPDAITVYNVVDRQPVYLNNCLAEWTGYTTEELVSMGADRRLRLVHPDDRLPLLHLIEEVKASEDATVTLLDYRLQSKEGNFTWIRNRSKVFERDKAGRVTHILSMLEDVTEQRKNEEDLRMLNQSLTQKAVELEAKNEEIVSFSFIASHDLKEPVRKLHLFTDQLKNSLQGRLTQTEAQTFDRVQATARRMGSLVDDLYAYSQNSVRPQVTERLHLNESVQAAIDELASLIREKDATVSVERLCTVQGHREQMQKVFRHLLKNALHYSRPGVPPRIILTCRRQGFGNLFPPAFTEGKGYVVVSVHDNGIGFEPGDAAKIFNVFTRLHACLPYRGTGMGLAIVRRIVEAHQGKVVAEGRPGEGASIHLLLPEVGEG